MGNLAGNCKSQVASKQTGWPAVKEGEEARMCAVAGASAVGLEWLLPDGRGCVRMCKCTVCVCVCLSDQLILTALALFWIMSKL